MAAEGDYSIVNKTTSLQKVASPKQQLKGVIWDSDQDLCNSLAICIRLIYIIIAMYDLSCHLKTF